MKIVNTFVTGLYAFKYDEEESDELTRLLEDWNDIQFLENFFEIHQNDLKYFGIDVETAKEQTIYEVNQLEDFLYDLSYSSNKLDSIFRPLNDLEYKATILSKQKSKRKWLRLYAIKIESNHYAITGGTIKLTHTMQERLHTQIELSKLEKCRQYFQSQGIFDLDSFNELDN
jgi:hypothetical protein